MRCLPATFLAAASLATAALAADCVDYRPYLRWLSAVGTPGQALDLAVGLALFDVSDPAHPVLLAVEPGGADAERVAVSGGVAAVARPGGRVTIYDVGDPTRPAAISGLVLGADAAGLAIDGGWLLVTLGEAGLAVVDVGDPARPRIADILDTPGTLRGVALGGDASFACVAAGAAGLAIVDLAGPAAPRVVARIATSGDAFDVALAGPVALVAGWLGGLETIDVGDPARPFALGQVALPGAARRVCAAGPLAFVAASGLCTVDVADPADPRLVGRVDTFGAPRAVQVAGHVALVATGSVGLELIDAADPTSPPPLAVASTAQPALGVAVAGRHTFVAAGPELLVYDHADPAAPKLAGTVVLPTGTSRVAVAGDLAYVTSGGGTAGRLHVVDVADPAAPALVGSLPVPGYPGAILVAPPALYLADFFLGGLTVVDLTEPADPVVVGAVPTPPFALALACAGDRLLVTAGAFGGATLEVFDASDRLQPQFVASRALDADAAYAVVATAAVDFLALRGGTQGGLVALGPDGERVGFLALPGALVDLRLGGEYAYVASEAGFVHVVDVADPAAMVAVGETSAPANTFTLALGAETVHAAATGAGLAILPQHCAGQTPVGPEPAPDGDVPRPGDVRLAACPNPFNPRVAVTFELPRAETITLDVFDLAGRRVTRLAAGPHPAGRHEVAWDGRGAPSGAYVARLAGESAVRSAKLMLVR
ncbi:MAG TPA: FlgD immunoglobulin-like domain containing protein [Candidatus Krumholzibacteria bacterium]|nr:FlgD immunoglobulin-like domain containing protein [Candidatus Krumholzibacteria bacterium]HPD73372.1 FlgD immunoglobulin-like domain containing protein [Candidatus Krumholzibacteria bacterium]HRY42107.1 FlgD immunoglobulin-like domain containing protein [Candidatus Krumholzibacteria bacterium]